MTEISSAFEAGADVAHFHVLEPIGSGAMGRVYLAEDRKLGRRVALKVLSAPDPGGEPRLERLRQEAQAMARVHHPNVVAVYDTLELGGCLALVLQYIPGPSLQEHLAGQGPLGLSEALRVAGDVARGLGAIHALGIVHRDIKPDNILLAPSGEALITDFGIARPDADAPLASERGIVGTPHYLAPELWRPGATPTVQGDLYALGICLHQMLLGRPPFEGGAGALARSHRHAQLPELDPERAPPKLTRLLARLCAKDPAHRPPSAEVVLQAIEAVRATHPEGDAMAQGAPRAPSSQPDIGTQSLGTPSPMALNAAPSDDLPGPHLPTPMPSGPRRRGPLMALGGIALATAAAVLGLKVWATPPPLKADFKIVKLVPERDGPNRGRAMQRADHLPGEILPPGSQLKATWTLNRRGFVRLLNDLPGGRTKPLHPSAGSPASLYEAERRAEFPEGDYGVACNGPGEEGFWLMASEVPAPPCLAKGAGELFRGDVAPGLGPLRAPVGDPLAPPLGLRDTVAHLCHQEIEAGRMYLSEVVRIPIQAP